MLTNAFLSLIETLFNLYVYVVVLRLLLQAIRVHFANPLMQFTLKLTQPVVAPLQKILPEVKNIDLAILALAFALELIQFFITTFLGSESFPNIGGLFFLAIGDLLRHFSSFYFYAIIFRVIFSLVALMRYNSIVFTITQLTEPLLRPIRRVVPLIGGFDLSPVVVLILLQLFEMIIVNWLMQIGSALT